MFVKSLGFFFVFVVLMLTHLYLTNVDPIYSCFFGLNPICRRLKPTCETKRVMHKHGFHKHAGKWAVRQNPNARACLQAQQTAVRGLIGGELPAVYETHASSNTLQANFVPSLCSLL